MMARCRIVSAILGASRYCSRSPTRMSCEATWACTAQCTLQFAPSRSISAQQDIHTRWHRSVRSGGRSCGRGQAPKEICQQECKLSCPPTTTSIITSGHKIEQMCLWIYFRDAISAVDFLPPRYTWPGYHMSQRSCSAEVSTTSLGDDTQFIRELLEHGASSNLATGIGWLEDNLNLSSSHTRFRHPCVYKDEPRIRASPLARYPSKWDAWILQKHAPQQGA